MMFINFPTADGRRAILVIKADGSAELDRTRSYADAMTYGVWRGYWPISNKMRDKLLTLPSVKAAVRSQAAHKLWAEAVKRHGFGQIASTLFRMAL